eukprot:gnl/MRDRNA2_/MRDRNA2_89926_c0_seq1.p1 gnl/MRDRNA2_/MRDRNA2_89926_c0~~gnl/MRDRNA2_/MRDRNA2_89926_c0_seq1.p1  ORF type:complete len:427 (-),score=69.76 gnl/MRDRNA2_/MRDRNA2_89926_c0_seq1:287-1567(-)
MFSDQSGEFSYYESFAGDSHEFHSVSEGSTFAGFQSGDPYGELDDVTRGVSIAQPPGLDAFWSAQKESSCMHSNSLFLTGHDYEYSSFQMEPFCAKAAGNSSHSILAPESDHFEVHHLPPTSPSSQHFFFVSTTLFLKDCSPQNIGNILLDFFKSRVVSSITKVRLQKYTVKAEVFADGHSCTMKARVYTHGDKYAVEVQRKVGDAFILHRTFQLLSDHLEVCLGSSFVEASKKEELPAPSATHGVDTTREIEEYPDTSSVEAVTPLLAMATIAGLQAEAASALCKMANGGRISAAPLLESPDQVALALTHLLTSGQIDVVYPAACCMSGLAAFGEAGPLLAHQGLLEAAANQAVGELAVAQGLVGTALARAVTDAVQCCAGCLTPASATELQKVLETAFQNDTLMNCDVLARTHLEQALYNTTLI